MSKRAVDLSLEELAAMGANAALKSAQQAYGAGLAVVGTVDVVHADRVVSTLAQRSPSGAITPVSETEATDRDGPRAAESETRKPVGE